MKRRSFVFLLSAPAMASPQWEDIFGRIFGRKEDRIALGLREALTIGTGNAISLLSRTDGYLANLAVKILLPPRLQKAERALRLFGMGPMLDELIVGMNRAAERAAPLAKPIFVNAVRRMTFSDVMQVFRGGDTAATDYFRDATLDQLTDAFRPPVAEAMSEVGVVRTFKNLMTRVQKIPLLRVEQFDLETYVVTKALDGLFYMVGEEEKRIRRDPAARVTAILKEVFGQR